MTVRASAIEAAERQTSKRGKENDISALNTLMFAISELPDTGENFIPLMQPDNRPPINVRVSTIRNPQGENVTECEIVLPFPSVTEKAYNESHDHGHAIPMKSLYLQFTPNGKISNNSGQRTYISRSGREIKIPGLGKQQHIAEMDQKTFDQFADTMASILIPYAKSQKKLQ